MPITPAGQRLDVDVLWIDSKEADAPLIVFLHEGLGSLAIWDDFPLRLCQATGCRGLVYSRYGYGRSTPRPAHADWPCDYMAREAQEILPVLLAALGIDSRRDKLILFGHSDGGTIALQYAGAYPTSPAGIIVLAPHAFTEEIGRARIVQLQQAYAEGPLRDKLACLHEDPDAVFWSWSRLWLSPQFRAWNILAELPAISCPVLAIQGRQDQYGTLDQLDQIKRHVPQAELLVLDHCRHVPHQDQPQAVIAASAAFVASL